MAVVLWPVIAMISRSVHPASAIQAAGLPQACVLHGLRKTAARMLAEAGCTDREIMAITGHRTTAMVSHYTKHADQKRRATAAIHKLQNARGTG